MSDELYIAVPAGRFFLDDPNAALLPETDEYYCDEPKHYRASKSHDHWVFLAGLAAGIVLCLIGISILN